MKKVTQITSKGFYQLEEHASVDNKTEFLKHLNLNQNVVFVASANDRIKMRKHRSKSGAILTTTPLNDGINHHYYFTFKKMSTNILSIIFKSAITHVELHNKLPKSYGSSVNWQINYKNAVYNVKIWNAGFSPYIPVNFWGINTLPTFLVEIY